MSNRKLFLSASAAALTATSLGLPFARAASPAATRTPGQALDALMAGNKRVAAGASIHGQHVSRRDSLAAGQNPYAMVLSCADSRVPPEIIFDQSLGDLFVVAQSGKLEVVGGVHDLKTGRVTLL